MKQRKGNGHCCKNELMNTISGRGYQKCTHFVKTGCTATPYSVNGQDYNVGYVNETVIINGDMFAYAYVACGYVQ
jgi:hypothetical protein